MATGYLRPSSDISLKHSCNTGSTGYNLMNEVTQDGDSTYIYLLNDDNDGEERSSTSTFNVSGTLPSFDEATVNSSTLHTYYKVYVDTEGQSSNTDFEGNVTVDGASASWSGYGNSGYSEKTATLPTSGYNFGTVTNKTASVYTYLENNQTKSTDSYNRVTQIYIQVEYTGYWYIDSSLIWGCGCSCPSRQTVEDSTSSTLTFTLDSGKNIVKLLDNGVDVTSSVSQSGTTATYTISSVTARHTLQVYTELPFMKQSGTWNEVKKVYKKVSGSWVEQTDFHDLFDINKVYKQKTS